MTPRAYNAGIAGGALALLAPLLALSLLLIANDTRHDKNRLASRWQQETGGVTYAPPISQNRPFKTLRLADRLPEIDTVVFGSSTMMSLTADAFAPPLRAYNFAQSGNPLLSVIGEAQALLDSSQAQPRLLVIPLDWALGFVQAGGEPPRIALDPAAVAPPQPLPWPARLREALSLPRLQTLAAVLGEIARADAPAAAARRLLFEAAGEPYRCADGQIARDYDLSFRGQCVGFRADGSATFADQKRVSEAAAAGVLAQAASASSQYARALQAPLAQDLLDPLAALRRQAGARGVRILFLLPPLLPQLDTRLAASAHSGERLRGLKAALHDWSRRESAWLVDAGASERYGCAATEFIDAHHALPSCYRKILAQVQAQGLPQP
jgi:hypothetical protein